jgi:hypothetical protein
MEEAQIVDKPKMYQALGIVSGILELMQSKYSSLTVGEYIYCVTVCRRVKEKHQPGQLQNFKVYPLIIEGKLGFSLREVIKKTPEKSVFFLKGCWTIYREELRLIIYRNNQDSDDKTVLQLIWEEAPIPTIKRRYWQIEAELKGEKFSVVQAIGPFDQPRKSAGTRAIEPPESEPIIETAREPIALNGSTAIKENPIATKAAEVIEPIASSEIKAIAESPSKSIGPEEPEASPVVEEPLTSKTKKASGKSSASKKSSISPETAEPKKTKEKVKASSSKKPMSLAADRLFLGKQLPPGKSGEDQGRQDVWFYSIKASRYEMFRVH